MVSIRCLDQGVDIPKISHAIILASSQNPRQFIQRRGRVLRTCKGKYIAVIYDAVVVPLDIELEPGQISLLKSELQRSIQFSETAINASGSNRLIKVAIDLGIDPKEVGLIDTDGIEDTGEENE
jgi:superfamily II DNA or RNA helicase